MTEPWATATRLPFDARLACFYCGGECKPQGRELHCKNRYCRGVGELEKRQSPLTGRAFEAVEWRKA